MATMRLCLLLVATAVRAEPPERGAGELQGEPEAQRSTARPVQATVAAWNESEAMISV